MNEKSPTQADKDNKANQLNPQHPLYYIERGVAPEKAQVLAEQARAGVDTAASVPK